MAFRCCFWLALNQSIISAAVDRWEGKREGEVGVLWFSLVRYRPTKLELFGVVRIYVDIGRNFLLAFFYVPFFFLFSSVEILFFFLTVVYTDEIFAIFTGEELLEEGYIKPPLHQAHTNTNTLLIIEISELYSFLRLTGVYSSDSLHIFIVLFYFILFFVLLLFCFYFSLL